MTRGKMIFISDNMMLCSCEFNGDMYYDGHGKDVISALELCDDNAMFQHLVAEFNLDTFHYNDVILVQDLYENSKNREETLAYYMNLSLNYIDKWFSDYLYIKNGSSKPVHIVTPDFETDLDVGEVSSFCFGYVSKDWKENPLLPPAPTVEEVASRVDWECEVDGDDIKFAIYSPEYIEFWFAINASTPEEIANRVRREYERTDFNEFYLDCIRLGAFSGDLEFAVDDRDWIADKMEELKDAVDEWLEEYFCD